MGKVEKAEVAGLEETTKVEEQQEDTVDQILQMVDFALSKEVSDGMRGLFDGSGIYNFPKYTQSGEKTHKECDLMRGGCPMKGKQPHIHVVGIGVQGALKGMRAYGKMKIKNARPELVNNDGKQYWVAHSEIVDGHNGNELDLWYHEPVMRKFGEKMVENESAPQVAQSKCMRNGILAILPGDLPEKWVEDYRSGKAPFSKERVKEYEKEREAASKPEAEKPQAQPPAESEFSSEDIPDNSALDNMALLDDWLKQIEGSETIERLQEVWTVNWPGIKNHQAREQLTKAKDAKKLALSKPPEQPNLAQ